MTDIKNNGSNPKYTVKEIIAAAEMELKKWKVDSDKWTNFDWEKMGFINAVIEQLKKTTIHSL
jgi:hypothetical protein